MTREVIYQGTVDAASIRIWLPDPITVSRPPLPRHVNLRGEDPAAAGRDHLRLGHIPPLGRRDDAMNSVVRPGPWRV
ncbi:MAG: hypothetical protein ACLPKE_34230 [Streptosporangiaceae bacterium]